MARPGAPWYWKAKQRWAATIRGRQTLAPREIARDDRIGALAWYAAAASGVQDAPAALLTVADGLEAYLRDCKARVASGKLAATTYDVIAVTLGVAVRIVVDGRPFRSHLAVDVTDRHIEAVIDGWESGRRRKCRPASARYKNMARRKIHTAFRWMADAGATPVYRLGKVGPLPPPVEEIEICSRSQAAGWLRWLRAAGTDDHDAQFLLLQRLLIKTGARPSEIHRARWREVAWAAGKTREGATYGMLVRAEWKCARRTGQPRRIFLPPSALRPLRRRFEKIRPDPEDRIFSQRDGTAWTANMLASACRERVDAAVAAGRDLPARGPGRIRPYQWRHMAASRLVADGVDLPTAARLLGTSVTMLLRTYVHTDTERLVAAASALAGPRQVKARATDAKPAGGSPRPSSSSPRPAKAARRPRRPLGFAATPRSLRA